eukprot:CAMPEP_0171973816 /NCGR_PEP_ID=MMETSP0993-20121228/229497_1 /TAXON_ID=483369 /ORGANISM="non described non described, Strain CCMP2098" /LENGTH=68 /DNA_ID=CAMNT_0012624689 /DNA_START=74 /DNA_END=276 /DNA_ORIENTATION=+
MMRAKDKGLMGRTEQRIAMPPKVARYSVHIEHVSHIEYEEIQVQVPRPAYLVTAHLVSTLTMAPAPRV